nr:MAG: capsid protein [Smacoviridae sp.]
MVTNYIKNATYKEIYDIHTDTESTSILTLHTPINTMPRQILKGFFDQYRRFKYRGATVTLRPVAKLPADPEQISYGPGDTGIDPRDLMDPVLMRGYSGESLGTFLNTYNVAGPQVKQQQLTAGGSYETFRNDGWFGSSVDKSSFFDQDNAVDWRSSYLEKLYYQSLSDPGFKKIKPQNGFRKFFYPLVYDLVTTTQKLAHNYDDTSPINDQQNANGGLVYGRGITSNVAPTNLGIRDRLEASEDMTESPLSPSEGTGNFPVETDLPIQFIQGVSSSQATGRWYYVRKTTPILTSRKKRLGWLDTDSVVVNNSVKEPTFVAGDNTYAGMGLPPLTVRKPNPADAPATTLPLINMGVLIFPKAHRQEMFWRLEIKHHFDFSKYRPMHGLVSPFDYSTLGGGPILEWSDWDSFGKQSYPVSSVTSTSKNVELVDVEGGMPEGDSIPADL